ncbi:MAG: glycosyltransferase family 2 protein [Candidatus Micrarchaeia archaeon]
MENKKRTLLLITLNEATGLNCVYDKMPIELFDEVICVDGGSTDGTVEFLEEKGVRVVRQSGAGRGCAIMEGIGLANGETIVVFSPDGNEDPSDIGKLVEVLEAGYDLVIASRFCKGSRSDDAGIVHGFGNRMFTKIVNIIWGSNLTDIINGFRAFRKSRIVPLQLNARFFALETEMTIKAIKRGYKIVEIPTYEMRRIGGRSKLNTVKGGLEVLGVILRELIS